MPKPYPKEFREDVIRVYRESEPELRSRKLPRTSASRSRVCSSGSSSPQPEPYLYVNDKACNSTDPSGRSIGCAIGTLGVAALSAWDAFGFLAVLLDPTPVGFAIWVSGTLLSLTAGEIVYPYYQKNCSS